MKIGIFYASNTGFTEGVAEEMHSKLGTSLVETCQNIEDLEVDDILGYDVLILGIATWDVGDLPYDWAMFYDDMPDHDFSGTTVVMFGLGDAPGYPETFLDAMGIVYKRLLEQGAKGGVGFWPTADYQYNVSLAEFGDKFCGLAIDQDNEADKTSERLDQWCTQIKGELSL
jgi:flavodoxin long chain